VLSFTNKPLLLGFTLKRFSQIFIYLFLVTDSPPYHTIACYISYVASYAFSDFLIQYSNKQEVKLNEETGGPHLERSSKDLTNRTGLLMGY
jgi:hypothetical protein